MADEVLPFETEGIYRNITISNYGAAKRKFEDFMNRVNDAMLSGASDDEDTQVEMDKWEKLADEQRAELDKFEKTCAQFDAKFFGENIKVLAKKNNMKIPDIEKLVGVSPGYISRTVNPDSKKKLSIDVVWQIAKLFSVNMSDLLDRDLSEPPKTVIPVVKFIEKLNQETSESDLHWKSLGDKNSNATAEFFATKEDKDGNQVVEFCPPGDDWLCSLKGNIYASQINYRTIYIMEVDSLFEDGILIYTERTVEYDFEHYETVTELLCSTLNDSSGILFAKATELMNSIRLHKNDFTVSDDARAFIDGYLNPDEDLPFK